MNVGDEIKALGVSQMELITGSVEIIKDYTAVIFVSQTGTRELVYLKGAEVLVKKETFRCEECDELKTKDGFRVMKNNKVDRVCKSCRTKAMQEGRKKKAAEKRAEMNIEKINEQPNKKLADAVLESAEKVCIQVGKAFMTIDMVGRACSITLDHAIANDFSDLERAEQIAEEYGGVLVRIRTETILQVINK